MTTTLTKPIKWHGGKDYLAKWIIGFMPKHTHYVEPFFGGGSVLLRKGSEGVSEVANDLNRELANFWNVLRSPEYFDQLVRRIEATPFGERVFEASGQSGLEAANSSIVNRAWAFFVRARQSRQGLMKDFATLSRNRTRRGMNEQVSSWLTAIEGLPDGRRSPETCCDSQPSSHRSDSTAGRAEYAFLSRPALPQGNRI